MSREPLKNQEDSYIALNVTGGVSFIGGQAVDLFRAKNIKLGLKVAIRGSGMLLTRSATKGNMLKLAGEYTGKKYRRNEGETALKDLEQWILAMEASMPIVDERKPLPPEQG